MIDYKEMEKVIQNLNNYVEKLKNINETQSKLDDTILELIKIRDSIQNVKTTIDGYSKNIVELENRHNDIKTQIDTVLQDYKKLHSAFELLDIELKKLNTRQESLEKILLDINELTKVINKTVSQITLAEENILKSQQEDFKNLKALTTDNFAKVLEIQEENYSKIFSDIKDLKKEGVKLQKELMDYIVLFEKKNKIRFGVLIAIGGVVLTLLIVGLFL